MVRSLVSKNWKSIVVTVMASAVLMSVVWPGPLSAQGDIGQTIFSDPVPVDFGDTIRVRFANVGRQPVSVRVAFLNPDKGSGSPLSTPIIAAPANGGVFPFNPFTDITETYGVGIVAAVRVEGGSDVRISLEVADGLNHTKTLVGMYPSRGFTGHNPKNGK